MRGWPIAARWGARTARQQHGVRLALSVSGFITSTTVVSGASATAPPAISSTPLNASPAYTIVSTQWAPTASLARQPPITDCSTSLKAGAPL
jgi:hypothetical protein